MWPPTSTIHSVPSARTTAIEPFVASGRSSGIRVASGLPAGVGATRLTFGRGSEGDGRCGAACGGAADADGDGWFDGEHATPTRITASRAR